MRANGSDYSLTVKGEVSLSREEWKVEIPRWVFEVLWPHCDDRIVEKTRYSIPHHGLVLEVDEYQGRLSGLVTVEVELPTERRATAFDPKAIGPGWSDVTADARYKNKNLATSTALPWFFGRSPNDRSGTALAPHPRPRPLQEALNSPNPSNCISQSPYIRQRDVNDWQVLIKTSTTTDEVATTMWVWLGITTARRPGQQIATFPNARPTARPTLKRLGLPL